MSMADLTSELESLAEEYAAVAQRAFLDRLMSGGLKTSLACTWAAAYGGDVRRAYLEGTGAMLKKVPELVRLGVEAA